MAEHLDKLQLEAFRDGRTPSSELAAASAHVFACDACRSRLRGIDGPTADVDVVATPSEPAFHLGYDEHVEPYVDGSADETVRELVESHVEDCAPCATRLAALRDFKAELDRSPAQLLVAGGPLRRARTGPAARLAAAALVALAAGAGYLLWRSATATPETETARSPDRAATAGETPPAPRKQAETNETAAPAVVASAIELSDGGVTWIVDSDGNVDGTGMAPPAWRDAVVAALTRQEIETPSGLGALAAPRERLRGGLDDPDFEISGPAGFYVRDVRPALEWKALDGSSGYVVTVYDETGNVAATSSRIVGVRWTPTSNLQRGRTYGWQVAASLGDREIVAPAGRPARFAVLSDRATTELAAAERTAGRSHLLRGLAYAKAGLMNDARRELRALAAENPGNATPRRLLRTLSLASEQNPER